MTPKEALDRLDRTFIGDLELKVELLKALKKQMPQKPILADDDAQSIFYPVYICPACNGNFQGTGVAEYCYHCGQFLDWSDADEYENKWERIHRA